MTETLCECGCGQPAPLAPYNRAARGWVKGQPIRFVNGHSLRLAHVNGERHREWKGDKAGYSSIHQWVARHKTKTGKCQGCGEERFTEWANVSGQYKRDLTDYIELCVPCHRKLDRTRTAPSKRKVEVG